MAVRNQGSCGSLISIMYMYVYRMQKVMGSSPTRGSSFFFENECLGICVVLAWLSSGSIRGQNYHARMHMYAHVHVHVHVRRCEHVLPKNTNVAAQCLNWTIHSVTSVS